MPHSLLYLCATWPDPPGETFVHQDRLDNISSAMTFWFGHHAAAHALLERKRPNIPCFLSTRGKKVRAWRKGPPRRSLYRQIAIIMTAVSINRLMVKSDDTQGRPTEWMNTNQVRILEGFVYSRKRLPLNL